ncbi:hypothetical protein P9112_003199 [Eukaryota sp. TZLM1-RC]
MYDIDYRLYIGPAVIAESCSCFMRKSGLFPITNVIFWTSKLIFYFIQPFCFNPLCGHESFQLQDS